MNVRLEAALQSLPDTYAALLGGRGVRVGMRECGAQRWVSRTEPNINTQARGA